ncbi:MAG: AI-2E family transporter [Leptospirales bacterium]|nr:AI-2E family transporter [Leptospirales bacterium]
MNTSTRVYWLLGLLAALLLLGWLLFALADVLFPVFFSLIVAYLLNPAISWLQRRGIPRSIGILIILLAFAAFVSAFAVFLYPSIRYQVQRLADTMPQLSDRLQNQGLPWLRDTFGFVLPEDVSSAVARYGENLKEALPAILNRAGAWLLSAVTTTGAVISSLLNIVLIPLFLFYFLRDFDRMRSALTPLIPPAYRELVLSRLRAMDEVVGQWFRGQLQVAGILAVLYSAGFGLVFHLAGLQANTGIAVGILTGCLSVAPYVGAITGSVLSVLFALLDWHGPGALVGIAIVFAIVQVTEGYVLTPRIVGEKLGLSQATVIIALLAGGSLGGLPGVLFALPVTGALKILGADLLSWYTRSPFYAAVPAASEAKQSAPRFPERRKIRSARRSRGARA